MSWSVSTQNTKGGAPLYCDPGSCGAYSSTGYEVAGLLLAAVLAPSAAWYDFDLGSAIFEDRSAYPSMSFPPTGNSSTKLSHYLTVPGTSVASTWPKTIIYDQNPSILGFTCGSMVASPRDVAKFFYHLLDPSAAHADPKPLISDASRAEMTNFQTLTTGWMGGRLKYGAGMMNLTYGGHHVGPGGTGRIHVLGHEGDTYGFLSTEGYVPALKGAFSVASNIDQEQPMAAMACLLLQTVLTKVGGSTVSLGCRLYEGEVFV
jgi:CubicO group peptidase (beta-lactamase class C family)